MLFLFGGQQVYADTEQVYVLPIEGEVGPAMVEFVSKSIEEAEKSNVSAIILNINTPGGQVNSAIAISEAILKTSIRTIAYVNGEAISAGTIITISAEEIYMSPASTIGAAETRPNEEKYISYWTGKLRNVAQIRGRDPILIASMADVDIEIEGVIEKGKLLTLTSQEALEHDLIDGVEKNIEEVQNASNLQKSLMNELSPSFQLRLASMATSVTATSILLTLGFIGVVIEIFTPGFGLGGLISLTAFGLYFGGMLLSGFSGWIVLVIFIIGIILLLVEVIAPGFGIPGIMGIIAIFASIILASSSMEQALISLLIAIILTIIAVILLFKFAPRSNKFFDKITLSTSLNTSSGYVSSEDFKDYVGKIGVVITPLRPAGSIEIENRKLDVVSENAYIGKDEKVKIVKVEGNRIIVRKLH